MPRGVVVEDVDAAEACSAVLDPGCRRDGIGEVDRGAVDVEALGAQSGRGGLGGARLEVAAEDPGALAGEDLLDRRPLTADGPRPGQEHPLAR